MASVTSETASAVVRSSCGDAARRDQQQHQPVHRQDPAVAEQQLADSPQQGRA